MFFFLSVYSVVWLLDHNVSEFLVFNEITILFSVPFVLIYISIKFIWIFFFHILSRICYSVFLDNTFFDRAENMSHCGFHLLFLDGYWCWTFFFFVNISCLLCSFDICWIPLPISWVDWLCCYWTFWDGDIFRVLVLYLIGCSWVCFAIPVDVSWIYWFLCCAKAFQYDVITFV